MTAALRRSTLSLSVPNYRRWFAGQVVFMMLGAYVTFTLFSRFALDPFVGLIFVGPFFFLIGVLLYRIIGSRLTRSNVSPSIESLLVTFGIWLVLQNLAFNFAPVWHYAVVIGYYIGNEQIVLRSGVTRRLAMTLSNFERV